MRHQLGSGVFWLRTGDAGQRQHRTWCWRHVFLEGRRPATGVVFKSPVKARQWLWWISLGAYQPAFWMFPVMGMGLIKSSAKQHPPMRSEAKGDT